MKLINKTLIAVGAISSTIGLSFLGAYVFTKQSDQINGGENQTKLNLTDLFSTGNDFVAFVAPADQETQIATYNPKTEKIIYTEKEMEFQEFFDKFLENNNNETPIMRISKNGLNFFNEYLEAVPPKDFYDYVEWFVKNVAWGPEALTLKSFSIVRNVSKEGSAIILGGHKTKDKETKTIKFYPDSFFGSLPLFDTTSGKSNAKDRLLQPLNKEVVPKKELDQYLENIDRFNIVENDLTSPNLRINFRNLTFAHLLKDKKIFNFMLPSGNLFLAFAKNKVEAYQKIVEFNKAQTNPEDKITQDITLLEESPIKDISLVSEANKPKSLAIRVGGKGTKLVGISEKDFSPLALNNLDELEKAMMSPIINFRDIYNIGQYKNKSFVLYDMGEGNFPKVYENSTKAREEFGAKFDESKSQKVILSDIKVENKKLKLEFSKELENVTKKTDEITKDPKEDSENVQNNLGKAVTEYFSQKSSQHSSVGSLKKSTEVFKTLEFDAEDKTETTFSFFFGLKRAFNYKALVTPYIVRPEDNDVDPETNEPRTLYKIYHEIYQDLIEKVLYKYPYLTRLLEGDHLVKYIDENGTYRYRMENGTYKGLDISNRIPFLMLVAATDKDFKGVGIDFLKYVGAHEYGHHTTLQNIQNIGDGNTPILLGSLSATSSPSEDSYYNATVFREYLKARTKSLDFVQGANENKDEPGPYVYFKWTDENTGKEVFETFSDVWGSENKNVSETITNKRRRFVQDIKGLKEAAKLRGITINELFLLNSYDLNTGSINPEISGKSQFFDDKRSFVSPTLKSLFENLTDGQGNKIKLNPQTLEPIVIEYEDDKVTVKSVKIFEKNGDPVINVKAGDKLTQQQKDLESRIKSTLVSFLTNSFGTSGWNKTTTNFNFEPLTYVNSIPEIRNKSVISKENSSSLEAVTWMKKYFENRDSEEADDKLDLWSKISKGNIDLYHNVFVGHKEYPLRTQLLDLFGSSNYRFRINKGVLNLKSNNEQYFADYHKILKKHSDYEDPISIKDAFFHVFPLEEKLAEENPTNPYVYNLLQSGGMRIYDVDGDEIYYSSEVIAVDSKKVDELNDKKTSSVFDAYLDNMLVNYEIEIENSDGSYEEKTIKTLGFSNVEKWSEFASVDLTKISIMKKIIEDEEVEYRNFDIDYVKTKFDLNKFKENYTKWVNQLENLELLEKTNLLKKVATEQDVANEVMERFLKNSLQFLIKNSKLSDDFTNIEASLHKDLGFGIFKLKNFVLNEKLNRQNKEINIKDVEKSIKTFLKLNDITVNNGSDKSNHQLTMHDLMILLGKIQFMYKIPTKSNFDRRNVYYVEMLQFYFKDYGPSSDVVNYIDNPTETSLSGIFSDYTKKISETLTRDFVQITYASGTEDFKTLPSYVKGVNESNTGFEYFLSSADTLIWKEALFPLDNILTVVSSVLNNYSGEIIERNKNNFDQQITSKDSKIIELKKELEALETEKKDKLKEFEKSKSQISKELDALNENISHNNATIKDIRKYAVLYNFDRSGKVRFIASLLKRIEEYQNNSVNGLEKQSNKYLEENKKELEKLAKLSELLKYEHLTEVQKEQILKDISKMGAKIEENLKDESARNEYRKNILEENLNELKKQKDVYDKIPFANADKILDDYIEKLGELEKSNKSLNESLQSITNKTKKETRRLLKKIKKYELEINKKIEAKKKDIEAQSKKLYSEAPKNISYEKNILADKKKLEDFTRSINSTFFGENNSLNNGYFLDRWLRKELDWGIYDDLGQSVKKNDIRITGLKGEKITDVARATWIYLLKSKGVSLGTLTGNWRDKDRDANVFWGYVPNELASQIHNLTFEHIGTGKKIDLPIKVEGTNNLFYYSRAGDESTKVTLKDEGYSSWTTNYAFVSKYKNSLLKPNNSYKVYFTDKTGNIVEGLSLAKGTSLLGENNKTVSQSPTYFHKKEGDENGVYYFIQDQFNV